MLCNVSVYALLRETLVSIRWDHPDKTGTCPPLTLKQKRVNVFVASFETERSASTAGVAGPMFEPHCYVGFFLCSVIKKV